MFYSCHVHWSLSSTLRCGGHDWDRAMQKGWISERISWKVESVSECIVNGRVRAIWIKAPQWYAWQQTNKQTTRKRKEKERNKERKKDSNIKKKKTHWFITDRLINWLIDACIRSQVTYSDSLCGFAWALPPPLPRLPLLISSMLYFIYTHLCFPSSLQFLTVPAPCLCPSSSLSATSMWLSAWS